MKTLCIRCVLWVFSVLFIQHAAQAQTAPATTPTTTPVPPITIIESGKQKKPKVKKQWRFIVDADAGFANAGNKDLSEIFKGGLNASLGVKTGFLKNKLWVRPVGGLKYYFKQVDLGETRREAFRTWKLGLELEYQVATYKKFAFLPFVRVDNNWSTNNFTKLDDEEKNDNGINTTANILKGSGISYDAGIMIVRSGDLYVKLDYEYYKPELKTSPELVHEMLAAGYRIAESKVFNCSSINLSIGINLNFKK